MTTSINNQTNTSVNNNEGTTNNTHATYSSNGLATLNQLMMEMASLYADMRDQERAFAVTQQAQAMAARVTGFNDEMDSIKDKFNAAITTSVISFAGGLIGSGLGIAGGLTSGEKSQALSQTLTGLGRSAPEAMNGAGQMGAAFFTQDADTEKAVADFTNQMSQDMQKHVDSLRDTASQASQQLREMMSTMVQLHGQITSAVR